MLNKRQCFGLILAAYAIEELQNIRDRERFARKQRSAWVKEWIQKRSSDGFCIKLLRELREEEPLLYNNFIRMTHEQFDYLLTLVKPLIEKQNTTMRNSIAAADRLILTLRYLATGENFNSLQFLFRIPQCTISKIIPEVLDAIYEVLKREYLKVGVSMHTIVDDRFVALTVFISHFPIDSYNFGRLGRRCPAIQ